MIQVTASEPRRLAGDSQALCTLIPAGGLRLDFQSGKLSLRVAGISHPHLAKQQSQKAQLYPIQSPPL